MENMENVESQHSLYQGFLLHVSPSEYILNPGENSRPLVFDRTTGDISLSPSPLSGSRLDSGGRPVFGILGTISLPTIDLVVLITSAKLRGKLLGHPVYLASRFLILPLTTREDLNPVEGQLISLVYKHLEDGKFWFSYELDITRNLQSQSKLPSTLDIAMWEAADDRFFWNKHLQARLIHILKASGEPEIGRFIQPVMYGSFDLRQSSVSSKPVEFAVVSRRSRFRAGTRYFTRGVDDKGNPGNFNETEQIIIIPPSSDNEKSSGTRVASFVQTRGSAPFYWAEIVNLVFVPDLMIMDKGSESQAAFRAHINSQRDIYGKLLLLNLVKGRGREKLVKEEYEKHVEQLGDREKSGVGYTHFDLHSETSGGKWYRVDEETESFSHDLKDYGYFAATSDSILAPSRTQSGVVRTNCMDCLDRTNLMQTSVAKHVLNLQLHALGLLSDDEHVKDQEEFMRAFRDVWSDHGNFIARAYTGTGALRTDFTKTGVRTRKGVVTDKLTSLWRYIMNNHLDGYKQDAFDLMTGAWQTDGRGDVAYVRYLLADKRHWAVRLMPYLLGFALLLIFLTLLLPRSSSWSLLYPLALYVAFAAVPATYMVRHPNDYIAWPRLNFQPHRDAIYYDGPGARTNKRVKVKIVEGEKTILKEALQAQ